MKKKIKSEAAQSQFGTRNPKITRLDLVYEELFLDFYNFRLARLGHVEPVYGSLLDV